MDTPSTDPDPYPRQLSTSSSGRRTSNAASPEFEFWMVRNPASPQPDLLSADELFVDGVLLPLHLLHLHPNHHSNPEPEPEPESEETSEPGLGPGLVPDLTASKRWKDIFKKGEKSKKKSEKERDEGDLKRERKKSTGSCTVAELNINLWPFSRSRSAGNGATRPRNNPTRKVSSAPCSRSNSAGESKSRKWPVSPGRVGVHLGRASPVWQVRKSIRSSEKTKLAPVNSGTKARVLNLNVPMCIPYRHVGCKRDEVAVGGGDSGGEGAASDVPRGSNMFNFRSIFTKKVY